MFNSVFSDIDCDKIMKIFKQIIAFFCGLCVFKILVKELSNSWAENYLILGRRIIIM